MRPDGRGREPKRFECIDEFGECLLRRDVRRQKADDVVARGADDEAFGEQLARRPAWRGRSSSMPHMNPLPRISTIDGVARLQREQLRVEPVADRR